MRSTGTRTPFSHVKALYGDNLEKYSYQEVIRKPGLNYREMAKKGRYEKVRERVLEYVTLAFSIFMAAMGVYFLLTSIMLS